MQHNEELSHLYCLVGSQASFPVRVDPVQQVMRVNQVCRKLFRENARNDMSS